jgi:galactokinase
VEENERVREGGRRLRVDDLNGFGKLMRESHRSLRDLYEVSCRELDVMLEAAEGLPGYYGGRMTGGGIWRMHAESGGDEACGRIRRTDFGAV